MAFVRMVRETPPDAVVIDLSRRPAEGRQIFEWLRGRKASRDIPVSFINGELPVKKPALAKTIAQKLGIREGADVGVIDPPRDYAAILGVEAEENPARPQAVTVWFLESEEAMFAALNRLRLLASKTKLWIAWPKGAGFSSKTLRAAMIEAGLVDYKICSLGTRWSAIAYACRKS